MKNKREIKIRNENTYFLGLGCFGLQKKKKGGGESNEVLARRIKEEDSCSPRLEAVMTFALPRVNNRGRVPVGVHGGSLPSRPGRDTDGLPGDAGNYTFRDVGLGEPDAPGREPSDWHEAEELDSPEGRFGGRVGGGEGEI